MKKNLKNYLILFVVIVMIILIVTFDTKFVNIKKNYDEKADITTKAVEKVTNVDDKSNEKKILNEEKNQVMIRPLMIRL